jgi:hypothetical protein
VTWEMVCSLISGCMWIVVQTWHALLVIAEVPTAPMSPPLLMGIWRDRALGFVNWRCGCDRGEITSASRSTASLEDGIPMQSPNGAWGLAYVKGGVAGSMPLGAIPREGRAGSRSTMQRHGVVS